MKDTFKKSLLDALVDALHNEYRISEYQFKECPYEYQQELIDIAESVIKQLELSSLFNKHEKILSTVEDLSKACIAVHESWVLRNINWADIENLVIFEEAQNAHKEKVRKQVLLGLLCFNKLSNESNNNK